MNLYRAWLAAGAFLSLTGMSADQRDIEKARNLDVAEAEVSRFVSPRLTRFSGEEEFRLYAEAARTLSRARGDWWASNGTTKYAQVTGTGEIQSDSPPIVCPPENEDCLEDQDDSIVVTGARLAPSNPSITNNQMRGVEEGDIVKQIGQHLLILQDGRIFVVDTRANTRGRLALTDRVDVYRDKTDDIWYDEMLVFGDRILITGYSYGEDATELSVFRLSETGRLAREGVFYLSSNDYYSSSNYATRLIGDQLVIYTPSTFPISPAIVQAGR